VLCILACMRSRPQKLSKQARAQQASDPLGQACLNLAALQAMTALKVAPYMGVHLAQALHCERASNLELSQAACHTHHDYDVPAHGLAFEAILEVLSSQWCPETGRFA
jgi:hypothetical protein